MNLITAEENYANLAWSADAKGLAGFWKRNWIELNYKVSFFFDSHKAFALLLLLLLPWETRFSTAQLYLDLDCWALDELNWFPILSYFSHPIDICASLSLNTVNSLQSCHTILSECKKRNGTRKWCFSSVLTRYRGESGIIQGIEQMVKWSLSFFWRARESMLQYLRAILK